ncbi:MAG: cytochrome-c oxidase, cbb3-type subunit III [Gammaproteobacteria bacterium]|nr:cytochrome-c oxidase, cbb3-type subunit III [Gammaproteobacteria bacterium]
MNPFWSAFVIFISVAMMIGCLWLLFANARGKPGESTGHVWDDTLREYNNPLPRWWLNLFVLTVLFGAGYLLLYPGLGNFGGWLGWSSHQQMQRHLEQLTRQSHLAYAALAGKDIPALARDPSALSLGRAVFLNNCAGCHGADARGAIGFPNLTDGDWLYGGTPDKLVETITRGRHGVMPSFKVVLKPEQLQALVDFVPYWSDPELPVLRRAAGVKQFTVTCAPCHGADGKGNPLIGAPNLTDDIWLFGGGRERVRETILGGRQSTMPAWDGTLSRDEIRVVAAYVYSLSHQQDAAP